MSENINKLIRNCFDNLQKAEVLGNLLREKLMGKKDADVSLIMINSFIKEAIISILDIQETLNNPSAK